MKDMEPVSLAVILACMAAAGLIVTVAYSMEF